MEEAEVSKPSPPASKDEGEEFQAILRTRKGRRQRQQVVEAVQAPGQEKVEAEEERDSLGPEQTVSQPLVPKKKVESLPRPETESGAARPLGPGRRMSKEQRACGRRKGASRGDSSSAEIACLRENPSVGQETGFGESLPLREGDSHRDSVSNREKTREVGSRKNKCDREVTSP